MNTDTELLLLCQKIRSLRIQNQLSQREMAKKLGIGITSLQKIEQNCFPTGVRCAVLLRLHQEFHVKFIDMFQ